MPLLLALLLQGCAGLPSLQPRTASVALRDTGQTRIGQAATSLVEAHGAQTGVAPLRSGRDAFAARALLADAADRTLDVQYYIWQPDMSGDLLLDALRRAAARGVRVRLLLDDNNTAGLDATLAAFSTLANVEVRLFNPYVYRGWRALGLIADFSRLNRRMHNKSFTADNQVTIVGGRNVGNEYFGAESELRFVDLDVMAVGPVVGEVSADFDRYWNSEFAYPARLLLPAVSDESKDGLARHLDALQSDPAALSYREAIAKSPFLADMLARRLPLEWTRVRMVSDDPDKVVGRADPSELVWSRLRQAIAEPRDELIVVSPYFVPGAKGLADLQAMAARGVRITVLTNSLEATDVPAVHAGYAKRRVAMLQAGIELYELKRGADPGSEERTRRGSRGLLERSGSNAGGSGSNAGGSGSNAGGSGSNAGGSGSSGSSNASLHTKAFTVDGAQIYVGSLNFDPRSAQLNTELGFVIDSPALADAMAETLRRRLPDSAYHVRLGAHGGVQWLEQVDGHEVVHDTEPGTTLWRRLGVSVLSWLPVEWLL